MCVHVCIDTHTFTYMCTHTLCPMWHSNYIYFIMYRSWSLCLVNKNDITKFCIILYVVTCNLYSYSGCHQLDSEYTTLAKREMGTLWC